MGHRELRLAALLAGAGWLAGWSAPAAAEVVAVDSGIAVKQSDLATPTRGMTMQEVASRFGAPVTKIPAVGNPPISRWDYPGFVVYFEREHVIHSVTADS